MKSWISQVDYGLSPATQVRVPTWPVFFLFQRCSTTNNAINIINCIYRSRFGICADNLDYTEGLAIGQSAKLLARKVNTSN